MAWRTWTLLLTFIMHSVTVKDLKLIHCQNKIPKGGQAKAKGGGGGMLPPLKETLLNAQFMHTVHTYRYKCMKPLRKCVLQY